MLEQKAFKLHRFFISYGNSFLFSSLGFLRLNDHDELRSCFRLTVYELNTSSIVESSLLVSSKTVTDLTYRYRFFQG